MMIHQARQVLVVHRHRAVLDHRRAVFYHHHLPQAVRAHQVLQAASFRLQAVVRGLPQAVLVHHRVVLAQKAHHRPAALLHHRVVAFHLRQVAGVLRVVLLLAEVLLRLAAAVHGVRHHLAVHLVPLHQVLLHGQIEQNMKRHG